jgi:hypothetical protein
MWSIVDQVKFYTAGGMGIVPAFVLAFRIWIKEATGGSISGF